MVSLFSILVNAVANYYFRDLFGRFGVTPLTPSGYAHVGLALSTSCVALVNFFALAFLMRRRIGRLEGRRIVASFVRIAGASIALSLVSYVTYRLLDAALPGTRLIVRLAEALVPILTGSIAFFFAAKAFGVREFDQALNELGRRFRRR